MVPRLWALSVLLMTMAAHAGDSTSIGGLWIHHDGWQLGPANEDGDVHKWANAAIMNFCPRGEFRISTGVVYQDSKSPGVQIGASDGLAIYRGRWRLDAGKILVEYKLTDAEFRDLLADPVASASHSTELRFAADRLEFPFTNTRGKTWPMIFTHSTRYEKFLGDEFVTCRAKPH